MRTSLALRGGMFLSVKGTRKNVKDTARVAMRDANMGGMFDVTAVSVKGEDVIMTVNASQIISIGPDIDETIDRGLGVLENGDKKSTFGVGSEL